MIVMGARSSTVAAMTIVGVFACAPAHAIQGGIATSAFGQVGTGHCCSAVQITANWVLTAHHVKSSDQDTFSDAYGASQVAKVYNFSNAALPENDLTLLRLATPIAGAPALSLLADVIPYGELSSPIDATIVSARNQAPRGYGFVSVIGVERQAQTEGGLPVEANYLVTLGSGTNGLPNVQDGDSGGALFFGHVTDSTSPLMGITSARDDDKVVIKHSYFVELSRYRGWIDQTMAADATDAQTATWVTANVPEPAAWPLWLAGLGGLGVIARRRMRPAPPAPR